MVSDNDHCILIRTYLPAQAFVQRLEFFGRPLVEIAFFRESQAGAFSAGCTTRANVNEKVLVWWIYLVHFGVAAAPGVQGAFGVQGCARRACCDFANVHKLLNWSETILVARFKNSTLVCQHKRFRITRANIWNTMEVRKTNQILNVIFLSWNSQLAVSVIATSVNFISLFVVEEWLVSTGVNLGSLYLDLDGGVQFLIAGTGELTLEVRPESVKVGIWPLRLHLN